jgi:hypothetical protein
VDENKQREEDETKRKAADKLNLEAAAAATMAKEQTAARAAADKKYLEAAADAKTAQTALATAQAACTKTSKDVALAQTKIKTAGRAKAKANKVHKAAVLQLALLVKGVADVKSKLTVAGKRKVAKKELEKLKTTAAIAETDQKAYQKKVSSSERTKKAAATALTKFQSALVPLSEAAAEATTDEQLATAQLETAMAAHDVSREAMKTLGFKSTTSTHSTNPRCRYPTAFITNAESPVCDQTQNEAER